MIVGTGYDYCTQRPKVIPVIFQYGYDYDDNDNGDNDDGDYDHDNGDHDDDVECQLINKFTCNISILTLLKTSSNLISEM